MILDTRNMTASFRNHFGVNGNIKVTIQTSPRTKENTCFTFYGNAVKRHDQFFAELSQVIKELSHEDS